MFNGLISFGIPLINFILFEQFLRRPLLIYTLAGISLGITLLTVAKLVRFRLNRKFFAHAILPVLLVVSQYMMVVFLEGRLSRQILGLSTFLFSYVFFHDLYLFLFKKEKYQIYSLSSISSYANIFIIFLVGASLFGFSIFQPFQPFRFTMWMASAIMLITTLLLTFQILWSSNIPFHKGWYALFIIPLIVTELFWAINFLPLSIFVSSAMVTLTYYVMIGLTRNAFFQSLNRKVVLRYLLVASLCFIFILATAKWA